MNEFDPASIFPKTIENPELLRTTFQYSARDGQLLSMVDAGQRITEVARDAFGRRQQMRGPDVDSTTHYGSDTTVGSVFDNVAIWGAFQVRTKSVGQGTTTQVFDVFGHPVQLVTPGFQTDVSAEFQYDDLGRLMQRTLPHTNNDSSQGLEAYTYDGFGRLNTETEPDGSLTHYFYPNRETADGVAKSDGWFTGEATTAVVVEKPRGNVDVTVRDPFGLPLRTMQLGSTTTSSVATSTYTYGPFNVLRAVQGPVGTTTIIPDDLGRTSELDDPSMGRQIYDYDGFDEVTLQQDGNDKITRLEYDHIGRTTTLRNDVNDLLAKWVYDGDGSNVNELGHLIGMYRQAKPGAVTGNWVRYNYQAVPQPGINRGLLQSIDYRIGGTPDDMTSGQQFEIGYEYQSTVPWRLDVLHYPNDGGAFAVQHDYDASGALKALHAPDNSVSYWTMLSADQGLRLKTERFGDGLLGTRDYFTTSSTDCASDPTRSCMPGGLHGITITKDDQTSNLVQGLSFGYDRNDNLVQKTTSGLVDLSEKYSYDDVDRLQIHARSTGGSPFVSTAYSYDAAGAGNITANGSVTYQYDDTTHPLRVTSAGSVTYQYDDNGNLKDRAGTGVPNGSQHFEYNDFNMPWQVVTGTSEFASVTELEYAASGARLIKRKMAGTLPSEVTLNIEDLYERVTEYDSTGSPVSSAHRYHIYAGGREVAQARRSENAQGVTTEDTLYIHDDAMGSTSLISNADQSLLERREFTPFGEEQSAIDFGSTGVLSGFTGQEHDPDLGLINMQGRLYDPKIGRFTTPDPFMTVDGHEEPRDSGEVHR